MKFWPLLLLALLPLGGCVTTGGGSVAGGACKVFEAPSFAVRGARPYDQDWIDSNIEGGIGACGWRRPAPRPPEMDAPLRATRIPTMPPKPSRWKRLKARVWHAHPGIWPTTVVVPAPPRSPVDELLSPADGTK